MKKRYLAIAACAAALMLSTPVYAGVSLNNNTTVETEAPDVSESMQVEEYTYLDKVNRMFKSYIITNHSEVNTSTNIVVRTYDANGELIKEKKDQIYCLAPEEEAYISFILDKADTIDKVEAEITHDVAEKGYIPVISDLDVQGDVNDSTIVLGVTNKSEYAMNGVQAMILYLDADNNVVFQRDLMFWDHNVELKPDKILYKATNHEPGYADIRIALTGKSRMLAPKPMSDIDPSAIDIKEYRCGNKFGNNYTYQIVTNNSDKNVSVHGNGVAKDEGGAMLWATDAGSNTLAPGETTVMEYWFPNSTGTVDYEYQYLYEDTTTPTILADITYETETSDEGLVVSLTNNGSMVGKNMKVYGLFFDADNTLLGTKNVDIRNDAYKLEPGETLSGLLKYTDPYDHAEIYVRGVGEEPK